MNCTLAEAGTFRKVRFAVKSPAFVLEDASPWWNEKPPRACRQLEVCAQGGAEGLPNRCRYGILASRWAVEVSVQRSYVRPKVEANAGGPNHEADGSF